MPEAFHKKQTCLCLCALPKPEGQGKLFLSDGFLQVKFLA